MSATNQYNSFLLKTSVTSIIATSILVAALFYKLQDLPHISSQKQNTGQCLKKEYRWLYSDSGSECDWSIIRNCSGISRTSESSLAQRYRLAGTYIEYGGTDDQRKAILDDISNGKQCIVSESEKLDDIQICRIFTDHVVIEIGNTEEQLWLSFSNHSSSDKNDTNAKDVKQEKAFAGTKNKFGSQIGEYSWVLERQALLEYYNELMNEPERLVAVFDSLKPIYDDNRKITGYDLDVVGEADFFEAVGLKQGDVVRSVNSMQMTNRHRAEYFIREFVADRANAFLFDIERNGAAEKLVYRVR